MARHEESIQVVWHQPTRYNALRHGPPYLPGVPYEPVKMSSEERARIRSMGKKASSSLVASANPLVSFLAYLQSLLMLHQTHHWNTNGHVYYSDHQLFERLYNESVALVDPLAEKILGLGSVPSLSAVELAGLVGQYLGSIGVAETPDEMVELSLRAELQCVGAISTLITQLEGEGKLSHGLSNLLEEIADKHETFVYLLRQRASEGYAYDRR